MKHIKRLFIGLVVLFALLIGSLYIFDYDYLIKGVRTIYLNGHKTAYLSDYQQFDNRIIEKGNYVEPWAIHGDYNKNPAPKSLEVLHQKYQTVAFIIIKNDSIWHETYFDGYSSKSLSNSFSMAKATSQGFWVKPLATDILKVLTSP